MNAGVSTIPRGNVSRPRRAAPSLDNRENFIGIGGGCQPLSLTGHCSRITISLLPFQEHRISIAEETVSLTDRMTIRVHHCIVTAESTYQHQQGGLGQMKVGQQRIDHFELKTGSD